MPTWGDSHCHAARVSTTNEEGRNQEIHVEFCSYLFTAWAERVPTLHVTPHELTVKHDDHEGYKEHEEERTMTTVSRCLTHRRSRAGPRAGDGEHENPANKQHVIRGCLFLGILVFTVSAKRGATGGSLGALLRALRALRVLCDSRRRVQREVVCVR